MCSAAPEARVTLATVLPPVRASKRQRVAAQAEADVAKINADADAYAIQTKAAAEAEANEKIARSLTEALIDYTQAQRWNGQLPDTYVGASDALPVLNLPVSGGN